MEEKILIENTGDEIARHGNVQVLPGTQEWDLLERAHKWQRKPGVRVLGVDTRTVTVRRPGEPQRTIHVSERSPRSGEVLRKDGAVIPLDEYEPAAEPAEEKPKRRRFVNITNVGDRAVLVGDWYLNPSQSRVLPTAIAERAKDAHGDSLQIEDAP